MYDFFGFLFLLFFLALFVFLAYKDYKLDKENENRELVRHNLSVALLESSINTEIFKQKLLNKLIDKE